MIGIYILGEIQLEVEALRIFHRGDFYTGLPHYQHCIGFLIHVDIESVIPCRSWYIEPLKRCLNPQMGRKMFFAMVSERCGVILRKQWCNPAEMDMLRKKRVDLEKHMLTMRMSFVCRNVLLIMVDFYYMHQMLKCTTMLEQQGL